MRKKSFLPSVRLFTTLIGISTWFFACQKTKQVDTISAKEAITSKELFAVPRNSSQILKLVAVKLSIELTKTRSVENFEANAGQPYWEQAIVIEKTIATRSERSSKQKAKTFAYIPFAKNGNLRTSAILKAIIYDTDTTLEMLYPQQYFKYGFETSKDTAWNAKDLFAIFSEFDYRLFGTERHIVYDGRIFGTRRENILLVTRVGGNVNSNRINTTAEEKMLSICNNYTSCVYAAPSSDDGGKCQTTTTCTSIWVEDGGGGWGSATPIPSATSAPSTPSNTPNLSGDPCYIVVSRYNNRAADIQSCSIPWDAAGGGKLCGSYTWKTVGSALYASLYNAGFSLVNTDGQILTFMFYSPCVQFSTSGGLTGPKADIAWNEAWNQAVERVTSDANTSNILDDYRVKQNMKKYINEFLKAEYGSSASFNPAGCSGSIPVSKVRYCN